MGSSVNPPNSLTPSSQFRYLSGTVHIDGMTCDACVQSITRVLTAKYGPFAATSTSPVRLLNISLSDKRARLEFDEVRVSLRQICDAIETMGFDAHPLDPSPSVKLNAFFHRPAPSSSSDLRPAPPPVPATLLPPVLSCSSGAPPVTAPTPARKLHAGLGRASDGDVQDQIATIENLTLPSSIVPSKLPLSASELFARKPSKSLEALHSRQNSRGFEPMPIAGNYSSPTQSDAPKSPLESLRTSITLGKAAGMRLFKSLPMLGGSPDEDLEKADTVNVEIGPGPRPRVGLVLATESRSQNRRAQEVFDEQSHISSATPDLAQAAPLSDLRRKSIRQGEDLLEMQLQLGLAGESQPSNRSHRNSSSQNLPRASNSKTKLAFFTVTGMTCASCVHRIETELKKKLGIHSVYVMLMSGRAKVEYDETIIPSPDLVAQYISNLGFGAEVMRGHSEGRHTIYFELQDDPEEAPRETENMPTNGTKESFESRLEHLLQILLPSLNLPCTSLSEPDLALHLHSTSPRQRKQHTQERIFELPTPGSGLKNSAPSGEANADAALHNGSTALLGTGSASPTQAFGVTRVAIKQIDPANSQARSGFLGIGKCFSRKKQEQGINKDDMARVRLEIEYELAAIGPRDLRDLIQRSGFPGARVLKANELEEADPHGHKANIRKWRNSLLVSLLFGVPAMAVMIAFQVLAIYYTAPASSTNGTDNGAMLAAILDDTVIDHSFHHAPPAPGAASPNLMSPKNLNSKRSETGNIISNGSTTAAPQLASTSASSHMATSMDSMFMIMPGLNLENLLLFILATPVQFVGGRYFYKAAWAAVRHCSATMDVLIVMATSICYLYSLVVVVVAMALSFSYSPRAFFDTPPMLIAFICLGRYLEHMAKRKAANALEALLAMQAPEARLCLLDPPEAPKLLLARATKSARARSESFRKALSSESSPQPAFKILSEEIIAVELLQRTDIVKILAGEKVPADGRIVWGSSCCDESLLTGESMPVEKGLGDQVLGGSLNQSAPILLLVEHASGESALEQIARLVSEAEGSKAPIQELADKIASWFVPIVLLSSAITFVAWLLIGIFDYPAIPSSRPKGPTVEMDIVLEHAFKLALSVLSVACPCALGLATPTAVLVATGVGARCGLLFKGGAPLEKTCRAKTFVFDKTGTLTVGKPRVVSFTTVSYSNSTAYTKEMPQHLSSPQSYPYSNSNRMPLENLLACLFLAESNSDHPIANAISFFSNQAFRKPLGHHNSQQQHVKVNELVQETADCDGDGDGDGDREQQLRAVGTVRKAESVAGAGLGCTIQLDLERLAALALKRAREVPNEHQHTQASKEASLPTGAHPYASLPLLSRFALLEADYTHLELPLEKEGKAEEAAPLSLPLPLSGVMAETLPSISAANTVEVFLGNRAWLIQQGTRIPAAVEAAMEQEEERARTAVLCAVRVVKTVATGGRGTEQGQQQACLSPPQVVALLAVEDPPKREARLAVALLRHSMRKRVVLMSGDNRRTAAAVAKQLGISQVWAEMLPSHKAARISQIQRKKELVCMVGDGINDTVALTQADVGVAVGSGAAVALSAASVVLVRDSLLDLIAAVLLSSTTLWRIRLNFLAASLYNLLAIPIAAGAFSWGGVEVSPWMAAGAMALSSVSVVLLSLLLKLWHKPSERALRRKLGNRLKRRTNLLGSSPDKALCSKVEYSSCSCPSPCPFRSSDPGHQGVCNCCNASVQDTSKLLVPTCHSNVHEGNLTQAQIPVHENGFPKKQREKEDVAREEELLEMTISHKGCSCRSSQQHNLSKSNMPTPTLAAPRTSISPISSPNKNANPRVLCKCAYACASQTENSNMESRLWIEPEPTLVPIASGAAKKQMCPVGERANAHGPESNSNLLYPTESHSRGAATEEDAVALARGGFGLRSSQLSLSSALSLHTGGELATDGSIRTYPGKSDMLSVSAQDSLKAHETSSRDKKNRKNRL